MRPADIRTSRPRRCGARSPVFIAVAPEQVVLGCGSGEILRMAIDAFVGAQKKLVAAVPTFESIGGWARRAGATVVGVP